MERTEQRSALEGLTIQAEAITAPGFRFVLRDGADEVARVRLYCLSNDLHEQPLGYIEDLFIEESHRGKRLSDELIAQVTDQARKQGCYKLIATSREERPWVHRMYERFGFEKHGREFRMDL